MQTPSRATPRPGLRTGPGGGRLGRTQGRSRRRRSNRLARGIGGGFELNRGARAVERAGGCSVARHS